MLYIIGLWSITLLKRHLLGEVDSRLCHLFRSSAALFSWSYLAPVLFVRSVIQVTVTVLGRPRDLLPSIFPSSTLFSVI